jgi:photosystem II stability/assembly factor-like uncharacterized protein
MHFDFHSFIKGETNMRPANLSQMILVLAVLVCAASTVVAQGWEDLSPGTTSERFLGVSFVDENTGWAAGWDYQNLYHTTDGGATWTLQDPVVQYVMFEDIDFCDANNGMATGGEGAIIYTKDGGNTWEEAQYGWWLTYNACHMLNPDVGMAGGANSINQPFVTGTLDSWVNLVAMNFYFMMGGISNEGRIHGICMVDENVGFAAGRTWMSEGAICKTSDGSATPWETIVELSYACYGIDFPTSDVGYACCDYGNILKSTDGGATWNNLTTGVSNRLYDIHFADENVGVAVGDAGTIICTTDGGTTWTQEDSGVSVTLNDVSCVSATSAFAAGDNGTIIGKGGEAPVLSADTSTVSAATGGTVNFDLMAGEDYANRAYVLLGGISGTEPGTLLPGGLVTLPLNWDALTDFILANLGNPVFTGFLGELDVAGQGSAQLIMPPVDRVFVGTVMNYAFSTGSPFDFASNAVSVEIVD